MTSLELMDTYYARMCACSSSSGRRYNFNQMLELYNLDATVRQVWDYIEDAFLILKRFVKRVVREVKIRTSASRYIGYMNGAEPLPDGVEQLYLVRLLDADGELVWSKVGTTTRATDKRMKEHLRYYSKYGIEKIIVDRVYDCGTDVAEDYENLFKSFYLRKFGKEKWRKNDRFCGVQFDLEEADAKFEEFKRFSR